MTLGLAVGDVRRLMLGTFVRPASETGTGQPRVEVVLGYAVRHPGGLLVLDTGMGEVDAETEAHYRPSRRPLPQALADHGLHLDEVRHVVNCHLHFDHCGGNRLLAGRPVFCQRTEHAGLHEPGYTVPGLVDHPGARIELLDGEAEVLPGVHVVPTPGHTPGHQSLVVRCTDGTVVLAGQSHDRASDYGADQLAWQARGDGVAEPLPPVPAWMERLQRFDPARVVFAHDAAVWEPSEHSRLC